MELPRLLLLTDRAQLRLGRSLVRTVAECVDAGATHVVVRELDEPDAARAALAAALTAVGATVIAAHRPLPGAVALHLPATTYQSGAVGQESTPGMPTLPTCPDRYAFGRSCHSRAEVAGAAAEGAAWATLSPYAGTRSKPGHGPALAAGDYRDHPIPVLALGGITPANAAAAREGGAHGVAVMGAVMRSDDPARVVRELLAALR